MWTLISGSSFSTQVKGNDELERAQEFDHDLKEEEELDDILEGEEQDSKREFF